MIAAGVCASYTSQALSGMSIVVSFNVMDANCPVSLASYQSTPTGHTHEAYATGLFATGAWSLTVPLSCHTSNEVDLFIGGPPLVLGGPNASPDLGAWAIFLPCG